MRKIRRSGRRGTDGRRNIVSTFAVNFVVSLMVTGSRSPAEVDVRTEYAPLRPNGSRNHPPLWKIYAKDRIERDIDARAFRAEYETEQGKAEPLRQTPYLRQLPKYWAAFHVAHSNREYR